MRLKAIAWLLPTLLALLLSCQHSVPCHTAAKASADSAPLDDEAVDSDNDGLFETLRARVFLDVRTKGTYTVAATLMSTNGIIIDQRSEEKLLKPGARFIDIEFSARRIAGGDEGCRQWNENRVDGPYVVTNVYAYELVRTKDGEQQLVDCAQQYEGGYLTKPYRYQDFDTGSSK